MPHLMMPLRSRQELDVLTRWLRDTTGYWPSVEHSTLTEEGRTYPMHTVVLSGRWNTPQLQAVYVDRT